MPPRLLLADDSVTVQRVIELTFADENVTVVAVGSGDEAVARLDTESFDIVLADAGMPGRDGFDVARFVRERPATAHVPVVLLTGAYEQVDQARVAACGASAVLPKPFEPQAVILKVRELLARRGAAPVAPAPAPAGAPAGVAAGGPPAAAAIAPAGAAQASASVDEYFDRLDRAFASLETPASSRTPAAPTASPSTGPPQPPGSQASVEPPVTGAREGMVDGPAPAGAADLAAGGPASQDPADPAAGLADAFVALLAMEQGEPLPAGLAPARSAADDEALVERIAQRVIERLGDRAVRDLTADIVSRTAERLVRDEIERLKQLP
jgi:CheY-like chemotaxis protein